LRENFDSFEDTKEVLKGVDAFLCCLGSRVGTGEANFRKVDFEYPLAFARLAKELGIRHYGLLTSTGADSSSMLLYMRTKGQVEEAVVAVALPSLIVYRPGFLKNRRNDERFGEKVLGWISFMITGIESRDMGAAMIEHTIA